MAWDRNPRLRVIADKFLVRGYIAQRVGETDLVPLIAVSDSPKRTPWGTLPREFVIKVTHGSGGVIVVAESAPHAFLPSSPQDWSRFKVDPDNLDSHIAKSLIAHWFTLRYEWWEGREPEFAYRGLRPRIIVEELIQPSIGLGLLEVNAFVFNGELEFFRVFVGGVGNEKQYVYLDRASKRLPVSSSAGPVSFLPFQEASINRQLTKIIALAKNLSEGLDFIRVDFLTSGEDVYVGELTNYHMAGNFGLWPKSYEFDLGSSWNPRY